MIDDQQGMKINIYGVGRSGTKAVQLWFSALLAQKYGQVRVNFEPLRYLTRKLEATYYGWRIHQKTPYLLEDSKEVSAAFVRFANGLGQYPVTTTKFIRATGRIAAFDQVMQPDISILVVRDLYGVLNSILTENWGLTDTQDEWLRLCAEARIQYPDMAKRFKPMTNKLLQNALYWFAVNDYALTHLPEHVWVVPYEQMADDLYGLVQQKSKLGEPAWRLDAPQFRGAAIHGDKTIVDVNPPPPATVLKSVLPSNIYSIIAKRIEKEEIGSFARLNDKMSISQSDTTGVKVQKVRALAQPHPFLDELNQRIQARLESVLKKQNTA